ncbi:NAD(P)-binding domain-containing protein [Synechococcus sp. MEDNS5]|uniref:SDR family oxidoreductase n=1 Tax=Synechococcus sp. MEDNS5 TaxID=1442554 RepID=UPI000B69DD03|nr:SDR family oxidoreductase [Synechococcus sp. MEDNS5]OUX73718.1 MAG: NADH-flavin reductase [Synechococcus sp. TMED90]QNJ05592.1 NAD(P)-binding domain-containing protein [Synechococcus sp. MEDNS5]
MSPRTIAISGASGKTGFRIAEEVLAAGDQPRLLLRADSQIPASLEGCEQHRLSLLDPSALDHALLGADALVIATGARPSVDLTGPMRVDAWGVQRQLESCQRVGLRRVVLVSSLCSGRWRHPLNLFGLILVWKRVGERSLERSGLDWTVIRPGGLSEREEALESEGVFWTGPDQQESQSIPRRLVARCCLEALNTQGSIGRILEVTSNAEQPPQPLSEVLLSIDAYGAAASTAR